MVLNDASEQGLSSRIMMDCMMSTFRELKLRRAQIPRLEDLIANPPVRDPEEVSTLNDAPSASSDEDYEYSSTTSILSIEEEASYPWEINIAASSLTDVQERSMAMTKTTAWLRSPDELLAEGTSEGNPCSSSGSYRLSDDAEVHFTSTNSSLEGETSSSRSVVLKKRGVPECSDIQDGPRTHVPNPKVVSSLKRLALEKKYLLPAGYRLTCTGRAFAITHSIQRGPKETRDLRWYCFSNKKGFITAIEKNSKVKNWKYDFLFVQSEAEQARAKLSPLEFGDATAEQVTAGAEKVQEEAPPLTPCSKELVVGSLNLPHLILHKRSGFYRQKEEIVAKYKRRSEKLKKEKGTLEAEKADLEC
ncbi:hypothetical protein Cgig2_011981 [Carnegiea gigantea]|uniref:Uncharacterized protein n=1 Tax=Carnegiea gigantea TaxID=171969 RepID=A0A9Q1GMZ3_9CARY|nr:hypothetical protein Cgig2_011981 [Carnegiea gigantea]